MLNHILKDGMNFPVIERDIYPWFFKEESIMYILCPRDTDIPGTPYRFCSAIPPFNNAFLDVMGYFARLISLKTYSLSVMDKAPKILAHRFYLLLRGV